MSKLALRYGLIGGGILVLVFLIPFLIFGETTDYDRGEVIGYFSMILPMIVVFFGIKAYRDKYSSGRMSFWKGVGTGVYISIIAGIIFGIYSFMLYAWVMPDFTEKYYNYQIESIEKSDMPAAEKEAEVNEIKDMPGWQKSPAFGGALSLTAIFIFGLMISLVSAAILKRSDVSESKQTTLVN